MLTKKQRRDKGLVGRVKLIEEKTGREVIIDFDETPVFTREEWENLKIGQPGMKPFSEMTEEEQKVFTEFEGEEDELSN